MSETAEINLDADGGIAIPGVDGWRFFPRPTMAQIARAYESIESFRADEATWVDFVNFVATALYFESDAGWFRLDRFHVGLSAELHGATFTGRGAPETDTNVRKLLDFIIEDNNLVCINSTIPDHNEMVIKWFKRIGFIPTGVIPAYNLWAGQPRSLLLFSYMRGSKQ